MYGLKDRMAVYLPNKTDGDYTVVDKKNVPCRLTLVQRAAASVGGEREAIGSNRLVLWAAPYEMPDDAQLEICGDRWNVAAGSYAPVHGPDGKTVVYRRCDVTKVL